MKKIISLMQNIGFTQYESQVYLALLQQSHITGYELAKISGVPASKIYQILNKLTDKEMVLAIDSDPKKYVPLPPEEILSRYKNDYLDTMDQLNEKLSHLYAQDEASESYIWNLSGRSKIIRKLMTEHWLPRGLGPVWKRAYHAHHAVLARPTNPVDRAAP